MTETEKDLEIARLRVRLARAKSALARVQHVAGAWDEAEPVDPRESYKHASRFTIWHWLVVGALLFAALVATAAEDEPAPAESVATATREEPSDKRMSKGQAIALACAIGGIGLVVGVLLKDGEG